MLIDWITSDAGFTHIETLLIAGLWMAAGVTYGRRNP